MKLFKRWMKNPVVEEELVPDTEYEWLFNPCVGDCSDCVCMNTCADSTYHEIFPEDLAAAALMLSGLIDNAKDPRIDKFWELFESGMMRNGFMSED